MRKIEFKEDKVMDAVDAGTAPMLDWIAVENLVVDDTYQRDLKIGSWKAIRNIANNFRWSRFSPVFVAPIEGGLFAIIDGQHRTHAAAMCGQKKVPCQIVQMSLQEQAASFAAVNGMVTKVSNFQIFKAALTAREHWAVQMQECAEKAGCRVMISNGSSWSKKPGEIYCITVFRKLIDVNDNFDVQLALETLMSIEGYNDDREIWEGVYLVPLLEGIILFISEVTDIQLKRRLRAFDILTTADEIRQTINQRRKLGYETKPLGEQLRVAVRNALRSSS